MGEKLRIIGDFYYYIVNFIVKQQGLWDPSTSLVVNDGCGSRKSDKREVKNAY